MDFFFHSGSKTNPSIPSRLMAELFLSYSTLKPNFLSPDFSIFVLINFAFSCRIGH